MNVQQTINFLQVQITPHEQGRGPAFFIKPI
jgi:hypothetical protein